MLIWTQLENRKFDLLKELVKTRFKLRYNNSVLGFVWVLMKPLLSFLILYFIFTAFRSSGHDPAFAANLFTGLILYYFFQEGVTYGMNSLIDMASVILKINFPREIALTSSLVMAGINLAINFFIIILITLLTGFRPEFTGIVYFGLILILLTGFIYGISLFLSILFVKIRDLQNVMELFFQLLFWASAVFYNLDDMQGNTGAVLRLNPLAIIIDAARKAFIHGEIAHTEYMLGLGLVVVLLIASGTWFFHRNIKRIAEFF